MAAKRWLNYQHYFYFYRVAQTGSVTAACRELRLAQPTVSAQLKIFEQTLGEKLFIRQGRGLALTETGKIALKYAEQIFVAGNDFLDVLEGKDPLTPNEVRVGIADVVPKIISYRVLEPAFARGLQATVICHEDKSERLLGELATSEVDLVLSDAPIPPSARVKAYNHFLGESTIALLGSKKIASQYRRSFPKCLNGAPLLLPTSEAAVRVELDKWLSEHTLSPRVVGEFQDRALMKIIARQGIGIIPVPTAVSREVRAEYDLEQIAELQGVRERFYLISVERRVKNPLVKTIIERAQSRLFPDS